LYNISLLLAITIFLVTTQELGEGQAWEELGRGLSSLIMGACDFKAGNPHEKK
jgi:hypothetical protein